jgi:hypothetical protein
VLPDPVPLKINSPKGFNAARMWKNVTAVDGA